MPASQITPARELEENPLAVLKIDRVDLKGLLEGDGSWQTKNLPKIGEQVSLLAKYRVALLHPDKETVRNLYPHLSTSDLNTLFDRTRKAQLVIRRLTEEQDWKGLDNLLKAHLSGAPVLGGYAQDMFNAWNREKLLLSTALAQMNSNCHAMFTAHLPSAHCLSIFHSFRSCCLHITNNYRRGEQDPDRELLHPTTADLARVQFTLEVNSDDSLVEVWRREGRKVKTARPDKCLVGFISSDSYVSLDMPYHMARNLPAALLMSERVKGAGEELDSGKLMLSPEDAMNTLFPHLSFELKAQGYQHPEHLKKMDPLALSDTALVTYVRVDSSRGYYVVEGFLGHEQSTSRKRRYPPIEVLQGRE